MKKFGTLLFAAVTVLAFTATSCRKDRTCVCGSGDDSTEITLPNTTKDEAQTACDTYSAAYTDGCSVE